MIPATSRAAYIPFFKTQSRASSRRRPAPLIGGAVSDACRLRCQITAAANDLVSKPPVTSRRCRKIIAQQTQRPFHNDLAWASRLNG